MTFTVDETALLACASAVAATGARVVAGAAEAPPAVTVPRWSASGAADAATGAAQQALARLGSAVAAAADRMVASATDDRAADDRAAGRLRGAR
jgi:hypothetical protein